MLLRPFLYLWITLVAVVAVLFARRQSLARREDESIRVLQGAASPEQTLLAQRLEKADKWVKFLTILAVVYGVVLGALYIYQGVVSPPGTGA